MSEKKRPLESEIEAVEAQFKAVRTDLAKLPSEMQLLVTKSLRSLKDNIKRLRQAWEKGNL
jgi:chromosome segregation ATPase